jgi:hypothetical protein
MVIRPDVSALWAELQAHLPRGFDLQATARARGAFVRARQVKDAATLLRLALAYGGCGMSLRETCAWAEAAGLASLANPSLIERLEKASPWLGDIVAAVIADQAQAPKGRWAGYRLRALDATCISEPGAAGATWRLHVGYDLASGQVDHVELTDARGGESLKRLTYQPGEIVLADRGYAKPRDLRPVREAGAHFIVRTGWNSLRLLQENGSPFDLFAVLAAQTAQEGEAKVRVDEGANFAAEPLVLRLVIRRKSPEQAQAEQKRLLKDAKRKGKKLDPRSLEAAKYVLLLTSLPAEAFTASDALALYRFRWQLELDFKRMKSLAGLDALTAKKPDLARAWIYARLIAFLIAEQRAGQVPDSFPSAPGEEHSEPFALASRQNRARRHPRQHSRASAMDDPARQLHHHPPTHLRTASQA